MQTKPTKQPYQPPRLDIYTYEVERGFQETEYKTTQIDNVSEIQSQTQDGSGTFENYTGEWF